MFYPVGIYGIMFLKQISYATVASENVYAFSLLKIQGTSYYLPLC